MSGLELCWEARLIASANRPLYVILMSSNHDRHRLGEALDSGADDFISKPPVPEELYARLRAAERLTSMQRELIRLAATDPLTGLLNRRAFFERASELCTEAERGGKLSAVMADIDHFKRINDTYGHDAGDKMLRAVAEVLASEHGVVGRLGGEEFVLLLKDCGMADAVAIAERIRAKVAELQIATARDMLSATCSFGVSEDRSGNTIDDFLKRADLALYAAKSRGRNRVVADDPALAVADYEQWTSVVRSR